MGEKIKRAEEEEGVLASRLLCGKGWISDGVSAAGGECLGNYPETRLDPSAAAQGGKDERARDTKM